MTEDQSPASEEAVRTGFPGVDSVLDEVDRAADLPADEQVAVFERAHEQLRRALDGQDAAVDDAADAGPDVADADVSTAEPS